MAKKVQETMSSAEAAERWGVSERTVRAYCSKGLLPGSVRENGSWKIPKSAEKPLRKGIQKGIPATLPERLQFEMESRLHGGIYHAVQIDLTYNSNHMEGSRLSHEQTRLIFETNTIGFGETSLRVDDIIETANHFQCVDIIIRRAKDPLSESLIKQLHGILKNGTSDSRKDWFAVGAYKKLENEVGGRETASPKDVHREMKRLIDRYERLEQVTLKDLLDFHYRFERIHPFQDGNGRIGRLILFKECLRFGITPFIIYDDIKGYYYRGLQKWESETGFLMDTCLFAQDQFKLVLDHYHICYSN